MGLLAKLKALGQMSSVSPGSEMITVTLLAAAW